MAPATERTPLYSSTGPRASRTRSFKIIALAAIAAAFVIGVVFFHSGSKEVVTPQTLATMNGSEPWSCGHTAYDAGYVKLANKKDDYYYYWFVESSSSDPSKDPLVLWLTGGAGGSSMSALLTENGPCMVNADGVTTTSNPHSWTQQANVIWLDQPTGVGFSYSNAIEEDADVDDLKVQIGANIYWFLQGFLDKHPEFQERAFFITGESYAGHYIPSAAHYIVQENKKKNETAKYINLQGVAIGNGIVDPVVQFAHTVDMAISNSYNITSLTPEQINQMQLNTPRCLALTQQCQETPKQGTACAESLRCFTEQFVLPFVVAERNNYDVRKSCVAPTTVGTATVCGLNYDNVQKYLAQPQVLEALHVAPEAEDWVIIRPSVAARFEKAGDFSFSYADLFASLLDDGVRVLVYHGDADLMCDWQGGEAWTKALTWKGKDGFNAAEEHAFVVAGAEAGSVRAFDNFAFLRVFNSGHMVPQDQPAVALEMINRFLKNESL